MLAPVYNIQLSYYYVKVEYQDQIKLKLREQRQNYVAKYRRLMEKIQLDGNEILKKYLDIGKVMQAKANKEMEEKIRKMLEDKLQRKALLLRDLETLKLDVQVRDNCSLTEQSQDLNSQLTLSLQANHDSMLYFALSSQARENEMAGMGGDGLEESHRFFLKQAEALSTEFWHQKMT